MNKKTLTLAFIAGLAANAVLAAMTQASIDLSVFVVLTLGLAGYMLYQDWLSGVNADSSGWSTIATFIAGMMSYSVGMRLEYPELGNIVVPLLLVLGFACWLTAQLMYAEPAREAQA